MTRAETPEGATPTRPVLFVADADGEARAAAESALSRRFGADYRVLAAESAAAGVDTLEQLARDGTEVALVAADLHLPGTDGTAFLERVRSVHPSATRVLLVAMDDRGTRIPFGALEPIQRAMGLGRIDLWVLKG